MGPGNIFAPFLDEEVGSRATYIVFEVDGFMLRDPKSNSLLSLTPFGSRGAGCSLTSFLRLMGSC